MGHTYVYSIKYTYAYFSYNWPQPKQITKHNVSYTGSTPEKMVDNLRIIIL